MSKPRSTNYLALVLKTQRHLERDLLVTLVTQEQGRVITVAKGVRQLGSTRRSTLEAGNLIHTQLVTTKGWPILTQSTLVAANTAAREQLAAARKFFLFLEILDRLLVAEEIPPDLFQKIIYLRELLLHRVSNDLIKANFEEILAALGYADESGASQSISQQVNSILDSNLRSFDYLQVPQ